MQSSPCNHFNTFYYQCVYIDLKKNISSVVLSIILVFILSGTVFEMYTMLKKSNQTTFSKEHNPDEILLKEKGQFLYENKSILIEPF